MTENISFLNPPLIDVAMGLMHGATYSLGINHSRKPWSESLNEDQIAQLISFALLDGLHDAEMRLITPKLDTPEARLQLLIEPLLSAGFIHPSPSGGWDVNRDLRRSIRKFVAHCDPTTFRMWSTIGENIYATLAERTDPDYPEEAAYYTSLSKKYGKQYEYYKKYTYR